MQLRAMVSMLLSFGFSMIVRLLDCHDNCIYKYRRNQVRHFEKSDPCTTWCAGTAWASAAPLRRLQRVGGVGLVPHHVARRPVNRWDVLPAQPQPRLHLGPVVAGVQHTPP